MAQNSRNFVNSNGSKEQIYKTKIIWQQVIWMVYLHLAGLYGFYLITKPTNWRTSLFALTLGYVYGLGVTAGAHRLWCHRSYKARWPLRVFLCILNSGSAQASLYNWCQVHRAHHKFVDTDADPHSINRGFFFAHMGWLMCKRHPDVAKNIKTVFMEDVWADPIVRFQKRFFIPMVIFFSFYLPTMIPVWCWGETAWNSFFITAMARYLYTQHATWFVNSAAHVYGYRPFDKNTKASENSIVALLANGEGWHNYHHVFPWDYAASELGYTYNLSKVFIDFMAMIGQAYDLKVADANAVKKKKMKSGDGTRLDLNDRLTAMEITLNGS